MRQGFIAAMLGVAALVTVSSASAAKSSAAAPANFPKIVVIDVQAVLNNCQRGREAVQVLTQKKNELLAQVSDRGAKIKALQDQLSKTDSKSSSYADLQKQIEEQQGELQDFQNESNQLLQQRYQEAINPIQTELGSVLQQYVKEHHIDILLTKAGAPIVSETYEVTTDIIGAMDKDWAVIQKSMPTPAPTAAPAAGTH